MKIKEGYRLTYDLDDFCIEKLSEGRWEPVAPISETAAMAWEGIEHGVTGEELVDAIVAEFDGADKTTVTRDLAALLKQLEELGYLDP